MRGRIPSDEREVIRSELVAIAERICRRHKLSIPQSRRVLHEILDVSV